MLVEELVELLLKEDQKKEVTHGNYYLVSEVNTKDDHRYVNIE